ncbi:MAG: RecQ family ATP-dependent DNA helicase [Gammaproteobacteria bacterium]|nr:RecQ family ATP-dependent DNA helicase [Gammaproteobacteria bacterium]
MRLLSVDLEVGKRSGRIHALAAVHEDGDVLTRSRIKARELSEALAELDGFARGAGCLVGHNLTDFDIPHLRAAAPDLELLRLPVLDTLRLSPLAFPANPYHRLVKHYQDGAIVRGQVNDPRLDADATLELLADERSAFVEADRDLVLAWHWLATIGADSGGYDRLFAEVRGAPRPADDEARTVIASWLEGKACETRRDEAVGEGIAATAGGWPLAYAIAWLSVAGGNSVMPPWVRHQFPEAGALVRRLRDEPCTAPDCGWCRERHDPARELTRWFGYDSFRPEPVTADGKPMQRAIVELAMAGRPVLGILPTGAGKSLCYQVPALSRYDKTGALTVVISPLVALMADQVAGLEARGIGSCVTVNGMLSMPERNEALDRVRLGDAAIVLISPEQLRNRSLRTVLAQREIGAWVLDEAHCLSRWGHDFRPDYRYVGRFIGERAGDGPAPPVMCLTATAKPDVIRDIRDYFRDRLDIDFDVFDGGARRKNLEFLVAATEPAHKYDDIYEFLVAELPPGAPGGAIVYCATRRRCEEVAEYLTRKEIDAAHFHAGLPPETKKDTQRRFIEGSLRVIAATNAFGMGIDKPDVRLVIHADIPGSLENYLQEAGRAGRDREAARCVLLYTPEDVERQFGMSARSRLSRREIHGILRALRNLDRKGRLGGEVVATPGEILLEDDEHAFERDSMTDDTRVKTAVAWLEDAALLTREENHVQVFPSSLRVASVDEARHRLEARSGLAEGRRKTLLDIVAALMEADPDEGVSTDHLMGVTGLTPEGVRAALHDLEQLGIATDDTALTAFVHEGVARSSRVRLQEARDLEVGLIGYMREAAPDLERGESSFLHRRVATQTLKNDGMAHALPDRVLRVLRSISRDGRGDERAEGGSGGSIDLRNTDGETVRITLRRRWPALQETAELRRGAAGVLLEHLLGRLPAGKQGTDLLAETTFGRLRAALAEDLALRAENRDVVKLCDRALIWLHEQEVIRLNKGLAVFRPAMTVRLAGGPGSGRRRGFAGTDFEPLALHYREQGLQIHVMAEYAARGLSAMADAVRLAMDYFALERDAFVARWLPEVDTTLQTTPEAWRAIVEDLSPEQRRIVADERDAANVLVLAGPGSGKTRVLVHRIAWLVRVRRENPRGILALAYNRHAAVEIRRRLADLVGDDARRVTVMTCHALAMRMVGASFAGVDARAEADGQENAFAAVLCEATALLRGDGLAPDEADEQRDRVLAGFRWILVDEYQDMDRDQYELIAAVAGRTLEDPDRKPTLFVVGDDDQNIYGFAGASVEYIRRFEEDYGAERAWLTENYRSTAHIVAASNAFIGRARQRMKRDRPLVVDRGRGKEPGGGAWAGLDPVGEGRVQVLPAGTDAATQAVAAVTELRRLAALAAGEWDWRRCGVIARRWETLDPVRSLCALHGIPVQVAKADVGYFWRLRETRRLRDWVAERPSRLVDATALEGALEAWRADSPDGEWIRVLGEAIADFRLEWGAAEMPAEGFLDWLAEWGRELRRRQTGLLLLTAHRAKGLEFDHVIVLDGDWRGAGPGEDADAWRRLQYVAMTRARKTLALTRFAPGAGLPEGRPLELRDADAVWTLPEWRDNGAVLARVPGAPVRVPAEARRRFETLSLADVNLSFAGRKPPANPIHADVGRLAPGDALVVRRDRAPWELATVGGRTVGRLAEDYRPTGVLHSARVHAIVTWGRQDSEPQFRGGLRCERWEVVVPEFVFEPGP